MDEEHQKMENFCGGFEDMFLALCFARDLHFQGVYIKLPWPCFENCSSYIL